MLARKITVSDFRNISNATVCFEEGINVLCGDNAEGKTNLLEAIYFASIGKSFRGNHTNEMIRFGQISRLILGREIESKIFLLVLAAAECVRRKKTA